MNANLDELELSDVPRWPGHDGVCSNECFICQMGGCDLYYLQSPLSGCSRTIVYYGEGLGDWTHSPWHREGEDMVSEPVRRYAEHLDSLLR